MPRLSTPPHLAQKLIANPLLIDCPVARHPQQKRWQTSQYTCIFCESGLRGCVDGEEGVGDAQADGVAFEEVGEVD